MKILAVVVICAIIFGAVGASAEDAGIIRVTTIRIAVRNTQAGKLQQFVLKNYSLTSANIGNAHMICTAIGGGPVPRSARFCWGDYTIGRSSIQVQGISRSPLVFELAITGGIGDYHGFGGTLKVVRYTQRPVRERLVFRLTK